jgi:xylulokinase
VYYIGYDIGSSSIKIALVDSLTGKALKVISEPDEEMSISAINPGWAEQDPNNWWELICIGTKRLIDELQIDSSLIKGVGIAYQMHGLVIVDAQGVPLRSSIIWCDSRAVSIGEKALIDLGTNKCSEHLLNSPANFTASKLAWVKENEPELYSKVYKAMLPGDYVAYRLTNEINTTITGLSEGIFWDFKNQSTASFLLDYYGISEEKLPTIVSNFHPQGFVTAKAATESGLPEGIPISYRAGDQPNNALSLNVLKPGEIAVTGGTSGVVYGVTSNQCTKELNRINHFAHVNYSFETPIFGKLLCINGAGILYRYIKYTTNIESYTVMNKLANGVEIGSNGLMLFPFGNGAERMLNHLPLEAAVKHLDLNRHTKAHWCRAALEGIAFAFVYGIKILINDGMDIKVIRTGNDNLFQSELFGTTIATLIGYDIEVYNTTGAVGAARALAITKDNYSKFSEFLSTNDHIKTYKPDKNKSHYDSHYKKWENTLKNLITVHKNKV